MTIFNIYCVFLKGNFGYLGTDIGSRYNIFRKTKILVNEI